jgi:hypothetical protein
VVGLPEPRKAMCKVSRSECGEQEKVQKEVTQEKEKSGNEAKEKSAN